MTIQISNSSVAASGFYPAYNYVTAGYQVKGTTGDLIKYVSLGGSVTNTDVGDWITPKSNMGDYEYQFTILTGSPTFGSFGTWHDGASDHGFELKDATHAGGIVTATVKVEIREKANHANIVSATITLFANLTQ